MEQDDICKGYGSDETEQKLYYSYRRCSKGPVKTSLVETMMMMMMMMTEAGGWYLDAVNRNQQDRTLMIPLIMLMEILVGCDADYHPANPFKTYKTNISISTHFVKLYIHICLIYAQ
jgi:hypothetical protein